MWQVFSAIVLAIVLVAIVAIIRARKATRPISNEPIVDDSSNVTETPTYEFTNSYDDVDDCRCSAPGGACCWK